MTVTIRALSMISTVAAALVIGAAVQPVVAAPVRDCLVWAPHPASAVPAPMARGHLVPR